MQNPRRTSIITPYHPAQWCVAMRTGSFVLGSILLLLMSLAYAQDAGPACGDSFTFDLPQQARITAVDTDGFSGTIDYMTQQGGEESLTLDPPPVWGTLNRSTFPSVAPIAVIINEDTTGLMEWTGGYYVGDGAASLTEVQGGVVNELRATRRDCYFYHPALGWIHVTSQWIVRAKLSAGQDTGGGGGLTFKPAVIEGFINTINDPEVTIGKEGMFATVTVTDGTTITLNGRAATLDDLLLGEHAKARYVPRTNKALTIKAER